MIDAKKYLDNFYKGNRNLSLDAMKYFMDEYKDLQKEIKFIHIAGTNGKGSCIEMISNILVCQGYKVGKTISPHLINYNERIVINGKTISDEELSELIEELEPKIEKYNKISDHKITLFELETMMEILYFYKNKVDFAVIETGLGGRYDSTNIIAHPVVSIITSIGYDHMHILGETLPEIATHKAGIIKYKKPILIGKLPDEAIKVVKQVAKEKEAPLLIMDKDFSSKVKLEQGWGEKFDFSDSRGEISNIHISMEGFHQIENATLAIETFIQFAELEGINYSNKDIKNAIQKTQWLGRFELLNKEPLVVIDGAHNTAAMKRISQLLKKEFADREVYVILAILADKQPNEMLDELLKLPNVHVTVTRFEGPQKVTKLADFKLHDNVKYVEHWQEAIGEVISNMSLDDMLLITGSLYFISEVRNNFEG